MQVKIFIAVLLPKTLTVKRKPLCINVKVKLRCKTLDFYLYLYHILSTKTQALKTFTQNIKF